MCLYPQRIKNRKYIPNKKNNFTPRPVPEGVSLYVDVPCRNCMECRKQRANDLKIRMSEEIRVRTDGKFINPTFNDEAYEKLKKKVLENQENTIKYLSKKEKRTINYEPISGYELDNAIFNLAFKLFRDRYRKQYNENLRLYVIPEIGKTNTERLHGHGIIFTNKTLKQITDLWGYGFINKMNTTWKDTYVSERTVNYMMKYITKVDELHKGFKAIAVYSNGIGKSYLNRPDAQRNQFKGEQTKDHYINRQGFKMGLPPYYRRYIYNDEEREALNKYKNDKQIKYVNGMQIDISKGYEDYESVLKRAREINRMLGYGGPITEEQKKECSNKRDARRQKRYEKLNKEKAKSKSNSEN